jgi:N6-adenosine-specific RNA methylase IME4
MSTFDGLGRHKYAVILADPPWSFQTWSAKGTGRSAVSHYDCMSDEAIAALPVADLAAGDCALFLWVPKPMLKRGLAVIEALGFEFKTVGFTWIKLYPKRARLEGKLLDEQGRVNVGQGSPFFLGQGYSTRANAELCLQATRGNPKRVSKAVRELIVSPVREHSRKPDEARERIEQLYAGPYLELFARDTRPGWDSWGDEVGLFDNGHVETRRQPSSLVVPA